MPKVENDSFNFKEAPEAFYVSVEAIAHKYIINLFGTIIDPRQFINAFQAFGDAGEDDLVLVNLSSVGGDLDTTDTFLQAMSECKGRVIVRASGGCHSAASIILLHADEFTLSDGFNCLIHCGSLGSNGTLAEFKTASQFHVKHMERILRETYCGFLTEEEIDKLLDGKDFFLNAEEFMQRFEMRNKLIETQH